jgi:hypothetical protein
MRRSDNLLLRQSISISQSLISPFCLSNAARCASLLLSPVLDDRAAAESRVGHLF